MEITIGEIILAAKAMESIADVKMPAKASYRLGRLMDKLSPIKKRFEDTRNELVITKYGVKSDEKEGAYKVPAEKFNEYLAEINSILTEKETIDITLFSIEDFGNAELPPSFFSDMKSFIAE